MKSPVSHLAALRARRAQRQADRAHTRALRARDEMDAVRGRRHDVMMRTAAAGERIEMSVTPGRRTVVRLTVSAGTDLKSFADAVRRELVAQERRR